MSLQVSEIQINSKRLREDLLELSQIGKNPQDHGVYRQAFTQADTDAKKWLIEKFAAFSCPAYIDGAGNVVARLGDENTASVAIGSHLDSVPRAGIFDGTLGVLAGLECARIFHENRIPLKRPLEVIAFADEEGRFGGMFGVEAICGNHNPDFLESTKDIKGIYLKDAMASQGLPAMEALNARRDPSSFHAFLELHIEQGPVLESKKIPIGIVEGISGIFKWVVRLIGRSGHAGTQPMDMRSDAFQGLADFAHEIYRIIDEDGSPYSRLTVGKVDLKPGFPHTIPGEAEFTLVGRDIKQEIMKELSLSCRKVLSAIARKHNLMFEYDELSWLEPRLCHDKIIGLLQKQAGKLGLEHHLMPSGAGHDTQFMSTLTPSGLIFVPSVAGISHAPDEWTHWDDVDKGANLLLQTALHLCNE
ncbi:MAG: Zn-dependent hydrolase [Spirochaetota bacterium]